MLSHSVCVREQLHDMSVVDGKERDTITTFLCADCAVTKCRFREASTADCDLQCIQRPTCSSQSAVVRWPRHSHETHIHRLNVEQCSWIRKVDLANLFWMRRGIHSTRKGVKIQ